MTTLNILKLNNGEFEKLEPGETIPPEQGGTGIEQYSIGDLVYAVGARQLTPLPAVASGNVLISNGLLTPPVYGKVGLTTHVSGILDASNGGTGIGTITTGYYLKGATGNTFAQYSPSSVLADIGGAPAVHAHSGSSITTGLIDPNRLGANPDNTKFLRGDGAWVIITGSGSGGGVTSISVLTANGISGSVTPGDTPQITLALGAITPSSINASGDGVFGGTLSVTGTSDLGATVGTVTTFGVYGGLTTFTASTASTAINQVIATIDGSIWRSGEFRIQATSPASGQFHTATILVVHNGSTATFTEFGDIDLGGRCGDYNVDFSGGSFRILVSPYSTNAVAFKIVGNLTKL